MQMRRRRERGEMRGKCVRENSVCGPAVVLRGSMRVGGIMIEPCSAERSTCNVIYCNVT